MPVMSGANKIVGGDTSPVGLSSGGASTASTPLWRPARAVKIAIKCQPKSKKCWSSGQGGPSKDVSAQGRKNEAADARGGNELHTSVLLLCCVSKFD